MKKKTMQKIVWGFITFIVIVSMLIWTVGAVFMK
jgi:hypothetical protein